MSPLPVNMFPLIGRASAAGGFVVAVLIGLAFYAAYKNATPPNRKGS